MNYLKLTASIAIFLYFAVKFSASIYVLVTHDLAKIQESVPGITSKRMYFIGALENIILGVLTCYLYFAD